MPWTFVDEETEQAAAPEGGWTFEQQQEPETSYLRTAGGFLGGALAGALDIGISAFGGGPDSAMGKQQQIDRMIYEAQERQLEEQGLSMDQIQEQLGRKPAEVGTMQDVLDIATGGALVGRTPTERVAREAGTAAGEFVSINALLPGASTLKGLGKEAGLGALFGTGAGIAEEDEKGPLETVGSGLLMMSLPYLAKKGWKGLEKGWEIGKGLLGAKSLPEGVPKFLTEAGTPQAMADLQLSNKDLVGRVAKTSEEMLSRAEDIAGKVAEPTMKDMGPFRAAELEKEIVDANRGAILDRVSPAGETQKKSWEAVNKIVEHNFEGAKETYSRLYDAVEAEIGGLGVIPEKTFNAATKVYEDLQKSLIKAPEEGGVKAALEQLVNTLSPMVEGKEMVQLPLDQLMAGKRSINRLLSKSDIIPAPVDLLKQVSHAMKEDILAGLAQRPNVKGMFEAAETQFAEAQRVFNNDPMIKARKSNNPEELGNYFSKPSNLEKLKEAVGKNTQVNDFIDRLVVENISKKSHALAEEMANETREFMSRKAQGAMDEILQYGDKLSSPGQQALARGRIMEDLQKMSDTGMRPDYTLKLMQNRVGREMVNNTLKRSPQGRRMLKQLHRMTIDDMMKSVMKDGAIDFEKAKDILKNPDIKNLIQEAAGKEGLQFFQQMETYGKNMADNLHRLAVHEPGLLESVMTKFLGKELKWMLYGFGAAKGGKSLLPILGLEGIERAQRAKLFRVLEDKQGRNLFKELGRKNLSPKQTRESLKRFAQTAPKLYRSED